MPYEYPYWPSQFGGFWTNLQPGNGGAHKYSTTGEDRTRGYEAGHDGRTPRWSQRMADAFYLWTGVMTFPRPAQRTKGAQDWHTGGQARERDK